jgi:hypothetical protein
MPSMRRRRYGERLHRDRGPLDASAGKRANQNDSRQCEGDDSNGAPREYPRATRLAAAGAQPMSRRPTHRCPLRLTSPVAPLVALDRGTHRPVPARQRALERFLPRLDTSKVPDGVHNPPLGLAKPAELADGLALARYAALRRRFAPATTWIASVPPLAGHGWHGDSARYVPRHAITPLTGIAATAPTAPNP